MKRGWLCAVAGAWCALGLGLLPAAASDGVDPVVAGFVAAVSVDRLQTTDQQLVAFGTRSTFSEQERKSGRGIVASRDWLAGQFRAISRQSGGRLKVAFDSFEQPKDEYIPRSVEVSSVIATLPGDDPARGTIVISSHLDSRNTDANDATRDAPGADDNGSGTSAVLESARILAGSHFPATIVFACFDGEEQGLFGSGHFASSLKARGVTVEADLNNDIIGSPTGHDGTRYPDRARLFSEALPAGGATPARVNALGSENDSPSRELARSVKETGERYVPDMHLELVYRSDRFLRGGDQESFTQAGFPAVRFVEPSENFDHQHQDVRVSGGTQYGDLLQFMDFSFLARMTQLNVAALATLALAPPAPSVEMLARKLSYDTTLSWKPMPGAVRYEVVWRPTTGPVWTRVRSVGDVRSVTMESVSKDDFIFGVRAVDAAGHTGPAGYPRPVR